MEFVEVEGLRIAYQRAGAGPPIVLIHSGLGLSSSSWRPQLEALSDEYTVVVLDVPGCGQSQNPPDSIAWTRYAGLLASFIGVLALERPHILGLSFGSTFALELYRQRPDLPRTLILAGAYAGWEGSLPPLVASQRREFVARSLDLPPAEWARQWSPSMFSSSAPAALIREIEAMLAGFDPVGQRTLFAVARGQDLRDILPTITVPTLLLYGENDSRSPLEVASQLHAAIPNSQLVVIPGVGHVCNLEAPDQFNSEVRRFLHSVEK
ncbi:MAG TPA: alpha/beta hydrolase [Ktedonobacterales bacterium]